MAVVSVGSVLGEQAVSTPSHAGRCVGRGRLRIAAISPDQYAAFEESSPARAAIFLPLAEYSQGDCAGLQPRPSGKMLAWTGNKKRKRMSALGQKQTSVSPRHVR